MYSATIKSFQTINFYCRITTLDQYEFWWNVYHIQIQKAFLQYIKSINWIKCSTENILSKSSPPDDQYWIFYDDICLEIPPSPSPSRHMASWQLFITKLHTSVSVLSIETSPTAPETDDQYQLSSGPTCWKSTIFNLSKKELGGVWVRGLCQTLSAEARRRVLRYFPQEVSLFTFLGEKIFV